MSKVTSRLAKRKNFMDIEIYMIFYELVHTQKQFVELAGHFVVRGEVMFLTVQGHPPQKKFPNPPIFNDFTACCVCSSTPDLESCTRRAKCFFPKSTMAIKVWMRRKIKTLKNCPKSPRFMVCNK